MSCLWQRRRQDLYVDNRCSALHVHFCGLDVCRQAKSQTETNGAADGESFGGRQGGGLTIASSIPSPDGSPWVKRTGLVIGPILFALLLYWQPLSLASGGNEVVAIACWMLCWWVLEAVPLAVTALLPMVLLSMTGVMSLDEALRPYSSKIVYLFFGGFMLALGLEAHGLHQRIALFIIRCVGTSPPRLVLGFLISTALLSMWISNTATAVMMLPMAVSVLGLLDKSHTVSIDESTHRNNFATVLILCIAYGANIGGMGTLIGTPPNLVMRGHFEDVLGREVSFFSWMIWAVPIVIALLATTYLLLTFVLFPCHRLVIPQAEVVFEEERTRLGPMRPVHWRMLAVFVVTASLWMFSGIVRPLLPVLPLTGQPIPLTDEIIALCAAISLFILPGEGKQGKALLDWEATRRLPWGILLLFGGGLSMANGLERTTLLADRR
jgi:solute carrier family 13 (sodium-dependent dicarboxylate transporter), member 2/3/5